MCPCDPWRRILCDYHRAQKEADRAALATDSSPVPEPTTPLDLEGLRKLAEAATPGPWRYNPEKAWHLPTDLPLRRNGEEFVGAGPADATICVAATGPADHPQSMADAKYIAAVDPATVLALLAALSEAQRERDEARDDAERFQRESRDSAALHGRAVRELAEAQRREELMRPVVEAAQAKRAAQLWGNANQPKTKDELLAQVEAYGPVARAFEDAVDSYETKESTDA